MERATPTAQRLYHEEEGLCTTALRSVVNDAKRQENIVKTRRFPAMDIEAGSERLLGSGPVPDRP